MLRDRLDVSERWACQLVGQHRSTERCEHRRLDDDAALRGALRKISKDRPRWGCRRAHWQLGQDGWALNRKRVERVWREEGLRVPPKKRKRRRLGDSTVPSSRLVAEAPNEVWAIDYQHDQTADGRVICLLNVGDEYTREALAMHVAASIDAPSTVSVLEGLLAERGSRAHIRCDNGTELTSHTLKDWCTSTHTEIAYVEPGSPWQNGYVESFNARVRDELLDIEEFSCLAEARVLIEDYQEDFNHRRPHSSLGMRTPVSFAAEHGVAAATLGPLAITNPDPVLELAA